MDIQGIITKKIVDNGTGKTGKPYTRGVFSINGKNYSTFDTKIIGAYNERDMVLIKTETKGAFENMVSMEKADYVPTERPAEAHSTAPVKEYHLSVEEVRARALEAALTYCKMYGIERGANEEILKIADIFLRYLKSQ